jgi:hypothetical protein
LVPEMSMQLWYDAAAPEARLRTWLRSCVFHEKLPPSPRQSCHSIHVKVAA